MSSSPAWLRTGVIGFVIVMFATACGGEEPATGSPTSQAPSDTSAVSGSQATVTDSTSTRESTAPDPTRQPAGSASGETAEPTASTTTPTTEPPVNGAGGRPPPPDAPVIARPVAEDNPHPPPSHLEMAVAPWPTDWSRTTIDLGELGLGIPTIDPRDLIRPLDRPVFVNVEGAQEWLSDQDPGMLVRIGDDARFYPLRICQAVGRNIITAP